MNKQGKNERKNEGLGCLNLIERVGNKLPEPFFLFTLLAIFTLLLSFVLSKMNVSAGYMTLPGTQGEYSGPVVIENLLSTEYLISFMTNFTKTYISFAPLGLIMVMTLAIGYAQDTGLFNAVMKKCVLGAPLFLVTFILSLVSVSANIASNAGVVFATAIGAAVFASLGRNPILGAVTGYVSVHGGFGANLLITGTDVLMSGITEAAAVSISLSAPVHPMINFYFMAAASIVIAVVTTFITEKIMAPSIKYGNTYKNPEIGEKVTASENRGLFYCLCTFLIFVSFLLWGIFSENGFLLNEAGGLLPKSPFIDSIDAILFFSFFIAGTAYGIGAGTIKKQKDITRYMGNGLKDSISFFVVALPAAFFIKFFDDSNLAPVLAVKGAAILESMKLSGIMLAVAFVLFTAFLNLFLTSGSSKWLILAPIFVPMFSVMNFSPALTQLAYRIGDSITNPIAPVNYFLPVVLAVMVQYQSKEEPEIGLGSLISMTLPYSFGYLIALILLLIFWMLFSLPLGPGTEIYL